MACCAGTVLTFNVQNRYNTYRFGGEKVRFLPAAACQTKHTAALREYANEQGADESLPSLIAPVRALARQLERCKAVKLLKVLCT
jgi:hypothetical protein